MQGGRPIMDVFKDRASCRQFTSQPLPLQLLSDLLWSAFGVNRPAVHGRTAPSAQNWQEITIYVAKADGLFVYEPTEHALLGVRASDCRREMGLQPYAGGAPLDLIYVADFSRATDASEEERRLYCVANTGFIAENVYLFCASERIGAVVRGAINRPLIAATLGLGRTERVILAQSVGYPGAVTQPGTGKHGKVQ
jgi:nitroreductase